MERPLNLTKTCDLDPQKTWIHDSSPTDIHMFFISLIVNYRSFSQKLKTCTLSGLEALWILDSCIWLQAHPQVHSCPALIEYDHGGSSEHTFNEQWELTDLEISCTAHLLHCRILQNQLHILHEIQHGVSGPPDGQE